MQSHGSKYPCAWCFGTAPFLEKAPLRTFGDLKRLADGFNSEDGGKGDKKNAQYFYNSIYRPAVDARDNERVLNVLLLDELHLILGK